MRHSHPTLLVVEDDDLTRAFLLEHLAADGYDPSAAASLTEAFGLLEARPPDLILCDLSLPDGSGLELAERVRRADGIVSRVDPATPLLFLTGRSGELDRIRGLERGGDDYLTKPFSYPELRLRIGGLLRRSWRRPGTGVVRVGELVVDPSRRSVTVRERPVVLTQKEYALLLALVREPTSVRTKQELLRSVWGYRAVSVTRTIDSHACRLRRKLGVYGDEFVVNVWGVGYRLVDAAPSIDLGPTVGELEPSGADDEQLAVEVELSVVDGERLAAELEPSVVDEERPAADGEPRAGGADPEADGDQASAAADVVVGRRDHGVEVRPLVLATSVAFPAQRPVLAAGGAPALLLGSGEATS